MNAQVEVQRNLGFKVVLTVLTIPAIAATLLLPIVGPALVLVLAGVAAFAYMRIRHTWFLVLAFVNLALAIVGALIDASLLSAGFELSDVRTD